MESYWTVTSHSFEIAVGQLTHELNIGPLRIFRRFFPKKLRNRRYCVGRIDVRNIKLHSTQLQENEKTLSKLNENFFFFC